HGRGQAGKQLRPDHLGRGVGDVNEHLAIAYLHRIGPDVLAPVLADAAAELELPVVPGAGQHAVAYVAAHQRVTLVRTAVVTREDPAWRAEQRDPLVQVGERLGAAFGDVVNCRRAHPTVAHTCLQSWPGRLKAR